MIVYTVPKRGARSGAVYHLREDCKRLAVARRVRRKEEHHMKLAGGVPCGWCS